MNIRKLIIEIEPVEDDMKQVTIAAIPVLSEKRVLFQFPIADYIWQAGYQQPAILKSWIEKIVFLYEREGIRFFGRTT
jgi:hypothetical protein